MNRREQDHQYQGFLGHRGYRWAWLSLLLCGLSIAAYLWHSPQDGPNGGSWLGYTLGGLGAAQILWLSWLGVRKRRYGSQLGTVKGWTSAHVYLGLSLLVIATLHCGFQFGWNIHTLTYALMVLVIVSGIWGVVAYSRLPERVTRLRAGATRQVWIEEVFDLNEQSIRLADKLGPEVHRKIVASAEKTRIGGSLWQQLRGEAGQTRDSQGLFESFRDRIEQLSGQRESFNPSATKQGTVMFMAGQFAGDRDDKEAARLQQLLDLLARRNELLQRINRDIQLHARLQLWLLFHVPLSFGLLAALIAHVLSVFFYW